MVGTASTFDSAGVKLSGYMAYPSPSAAKGAGRYGLIICHGFPVDPLGAKLTGQSYPQLADRLAADTGWVVLAFNFRGTGLSEGDFSLGGWLADLPGGIDQQLA